MATKWCNELEAYSVVAESDKRRAVISDGLKKEFSKIAAKDRASLKRWIEIWCEDGDGAIPDTRLKSQSRYSDDEGRTVLILAFKSYQARLYGFIRQVDGMETFLITAADADKKDDKADQKALNKAKNEAFRLLRATGTR